MGDTSLNLDCKLEMTVIPLLRVALRIKYEDVSKVFSMFLAYSKYLINPSQPQHHNMHAHLRAFAPVQCPAWSPLPWVLD